MFDSALLDHKLDKETYEREEPVLRTELLEAQLRLVESQRAAVVILVTGMDGSGKGDLIHHLLEWLDPRHVRVEAYSAPDEAERARPPMWRYWRDLPPKGRISVVFGSWYTAPLRDRLKGEMGTGRFERKLATINRFEEMLAAEGTVLLKFLLVLSAKEQKKRLERFAKATGGISRAMEEWTDVRHRNAMRPIVEETVRRTSTEQAPWILLPCDDPEYRDLTFGRTVLETLKRCNEQETTPRIPVPVPATIPNVDRRSVLDVLDLDLKLEEKEYKERRKAAQLRLLQLSKSKAFAKRSLVVAFEGHDAAGKGGAIRRVAFALDPRQYRIHPIAAPSDEEKARPYLWRFWRRLPRLGHVAMFDRTWYGRVLVERVEGFAAEAEWLRAYGEINDFEEELERSGTIIAKFWLSISAEEQLRRFQAREVTEYKQYKITDEDWRNRSKWDEYRLAISDMIDRTDTRRAPWTLVEAEDKRWARVKVLETLCERLDEVL
ncbi:MAG: polyphosphate:AMP phosphotransferase [Geminicoccaceae bacterium]